MSQKQQQLSPELLKKRADQNERKARSREKEKAKQEQRLKDRGAVDIKLTLTAFRGTSKCIDDLKEFLGYDDPKDSDQESITVMIHAFHKLMQEDPEKVKQLVNGVGRG